MTTRTITARHLCDLRAVVGDLYIVSVSAGPSGEILVLSCNQPLGWGQIPSADEPPVARRARPPYQFQIHRYDETGWHTVVLPETRERLHHIQPLGAEHWLAVRSTIDSSLMALPRSGPANAHVYDINGKHVGAFSLGTGVSHVQTDSAARIWVGYGDEIVSVGREPGLACFDCSGWKFFGYGAGWCDGLNVDDRDNIWFCNTYSKTYLSKFRSWRLDREWRDIPVRSKACAIHDNLVLFAVSTQVSTGMLLHLESLESEGLTFADEQQQPLSFWRQPVFGGGSRLYLASDWQLYLVDLASL